MSEFKFACPVCGQHITADARASGTQLECPTCFQKIIVPQAPASADSKFILSAAQVSKPRPLSTGAATDSKIIRSSLASRLLPVLLGVLLLALAAGAAVFVFKKQLFKPAANQAQAQTNPPAKHVTAPALTFHPIPTSFSWTLNLADATVPEGTAAGSVHGHGFLCDRVTLQGGNLSFRQGKTWPPELGLTILLFSQQGEELSGKTIEVTPDRAPPLPRLILHWRDDQEPAGRQEFRVGYALKLTFGQAANGRLPGQIYVCLPDEGKSFIAGTFAAEIRKASRPKGGKKKAAPPVPPPTQK